MNKTAIKKFAIESRQKLMKSTIERLEELGITDNEVIELVELGGVYTVKAQTLTESQKKNRDTILQKIQEKGYEPFVEEIAYTWFNRIIAIRYMEVNDYLPFRTRVLSSEVPGKVDPDIITEITDHIEELELNQDKVIELQEQNMQEELFKYVFIKVCNYLGQFLPVMFEQIEDYTELLLPSVMISSGSVIKDMIELVPEEDWTNQVEIIGWLYQYYISEKKDQVFADLKKNKKITKDNIPAATQLFTPKWIVKYMVENSLGRLWLEGHPNEDLKSKWKYYLEGAEQEDTVEIELEKLKKESKILTPEDLTIIDPAMGSGHILVYAFDVLYQIYQSVGYSEKEIPRLILEKNIHGLDIDKRAGQLAYFALMMKARSYSRRLLKDALKKPIKLNIHSIIESNNLDKDYFDLLMEKDIEFKKVIDYLLKVFVDAKEYGSLIEVDIDNLELIEQRLRNLKSSRELSLQLHIQDSNFDQLLRLIEQAIIISKKYLVCITNPPYMGKGSINEKLKGFIDEHYNDFKADIYASFIERCYKYCDLKGHLGFMTPFTWMFISSYQKLRYNLIKKHNITTLIQLEYSGFEEATVPICTFTIRNRNVFNKGEYIRLSNFKGANQQELRVLEAIENKYVNYRYSVLADKFLKLPGNIMGYWLSERYFDIFNTCKTLDKLAEPKFGMSTADNNRFVRKWYEVDNNKMLVPHNNAPLNNDDYLYKWFPYNNGGKFRRWYGNNEDVVNWGNDGKELRSFRRSVIRNERFYFRDGLTWTAISSNKLSIRSFNTGFLFSSAGFCMFTDSNKKNHINAFMNSIVSEKLLEILAPTLNFNVGDIAKLPVDEEMFNNSLINELVEENIKISMWDWNSFETSWDFETHPLVLFKQFNLQSTFKYFKQILNEYFNKLKKNEEKLNQIFIDIYRLNNELNPLVDDKDITIRKADRDREIKSFVSYAVGCMMGRYSLDEEGLIYAGGQFDESKYQTFKANEDGIVLISDTEYFEDDLLNRFVDFVKVVYGEETLEENLNFIADTECFKRKATESSRDCLRRYFLKGFMEDHLKVYQKRPIYWMFDSGKQNGFKALIYMHRYNEDIVAKVRTDYLHPLQRKYEAELERLDYLINFDNISTSEKGKAKKRQEQIYKQLDECTRYDLLLAHVAHQRIPLDLDDGVKVNYQKFQNIELTAEGTSNAKKGDLLYKVKM